MKLRHILQFSFDRISRKIFWYLLSIVLGILVLVLIIFSSFIYFLSRSGELSIAEAINGSVESYGTITFNSTDEDACAFADAANASDEILVLGDFELYAWSPRVYDEMFDELVELQNQNGKPEDSQADEGSLVAMFLDEYAFNICAPNLKDGSYPQNCEIEEGTKLIYLGYDFKSISIGSSFEADGITYIVAGIIKKGERFLYSDTFYNADIIQGDYTFSTDSYAFIVTQDDLYSGTYEYITANGYTMDNAEEKLKELADEYGLTEISFSRMKDSIDWLSEQRNSVITMTLWVFIITTISTVIIFMCFQLSSLWSDKNQFGVLLANGAGELDLMKILFFENTLRMIISLVIAMAISVMYIKMQSLMGLSGSSHFFQVALYKRAIPIGTLVAVCVALLSSLAPMFFVHRQEPVEMIRSFRG